MKKFSSKEVTVIAFGVVIVTFCLFIIVGMLKPNKVEFSKGIIGEGYRYLAEEGVYNTVVLEDISTSNDVISIVLSADKTTFIDYIVRNGLVIVDKKDKPFKTETIAINDLDGATGNIEVIIKCLEQKEPYGLVLKYLEEKQYTKFDVR